MKAENIMSVIVIGGGIMGQGIAQSFAQAGLSVSIIDVDNGKLDVCLARIDENLKLFNEFDLLQEDISAIRSRIRLVLSNNLNGILNDCDFIIEAVPEILTLKRKIFAQLDTCRHDVIVASNTSSFTIPEITEGLHTASRMIGVHYFNPAHIMPLVEIHYGPHTAEDVISATQALIEKTGKLSILVKKAVPGFVVNRLQAALGREAMALVSQGVVSAEDIDKAAETAFGFRWANIGTFKGFDMIGLDTILEVGKIFKSLDCSTEQPGYLKEMVRSGDLGIKSGRGFYDYHNKPRSETLNMLNRRLLGQLALFQARMKEEE